MKTLLLTLATGLALAGSLQAAARSSASYNVLADSVDAGGQRATTVAYRNDGSLGGIAGLSTVAVPIQVAKHGYIGQLVDPAGQQVVEPHRRDGTERFRLRRCSHGIQITLRSGE